jgi:hypothetical protein
MEDLISRQAAIDALEWKWAGKAAIDAIKNLPSAQPEIVRCEYCNKSKEWPNGRWCSLFRASVNTDSYCSFGAKRKEGREG